MMRLFGGFGPTCFGTHHEALPPAPGSCGRVALQQLHLLLVNLIPFGSGYHRQVMAVPSHCGI